MNTPGRRRPWIIGGLVMSAAVAVLAVAITTTAPVRGALATYTALIAVANRPDLSDETRLDQLRRLCSTRYLRTRELKVADEGGLVGIPRNIHKNHQAWRHGPNVWVCPTNRIGPVYQFVPEAGAWKFDGPVGLLRSRTEMVPYDETPVGTVPE